MLHLTSLDLKKDKAQYDVVIAIEGEGIQGEIQEKIQEDMIAEKIIATSDSDSDSTPTQLNTQAKLDSKGFGVSMIVIVGIAVSGFLVLIIAIVVIMKKKNKPVDEVNSMPVAAQVTVKDQIMTVKCPNCQVDNIPAAKYCSSCGGKM